MLVVTRELESRPSWRGTLTRPVTANQLFIYGKVAQQVQCSGLLFVIILEDVIILDTNLKGIITEQKVITALLEQEIPVSIPVGDKQRYDLIFDYNNHLYRLQVKTSTEGTYEGTFKFSCRSITSSSKGNQIHKYSKDEIDFFGTIWEDKCYLVPVEECSNSKVLRLIPPKNNQDYNKAEDYLLENQLKKLG